MGKLKERVLAHIVELETPSPDDRQSQNEIKIRTMRQRHKDELGFIGQVSLEFPTYEFEDRTSYDCTNRVLSLGDSVAETGPLHSSYLHRFVQGQQYYHFFLG